MSRKLIFGGVLALGVIIVAALVLGVVAMPVAAQGPWGRGMGGMMGGWNGFGAQDGWGPGRGYTQDYSGTVPYGPGNGMGRRHMGTWGGWGPEGNYTQGYTGTMPYGPGPCYGSKGERGSRGMGRGMMDEWGGWGPGRGYTQNYSGTVPYGPGGYGPMGMMGMMGGAWGGVDPNAQPLTMAQATDNVNKYLASLGNSDLQLTEVMEFTGNFYAEVHEKSTGTGAFELLVDRYTGAVYPEPGPNMMWNVKYGHMGGMGMRGWRGAAPVTPDTKMTVSPEQAVEAAQKYLDQLNIGLKAGTAEPFYGYYTLHTEKDGQVTGMLSVNGYTGAVWYHNWHGDFVAMSEMTNM